MKTLRLLQKIEAMHVRSYHESKDKGDDLTAGRCRRYGREVRADINKLPSVEHEIKLVRSI